MAACQTHLRRHSFSSARCTLSCLPLPSDFLVHWMRRKNKATRKRPMSQTLHCCKQLRLLLTKEEFQRLSYPSCRRRKPRELLVRVAFTDARCHCRSCEFQQ